MERTSNSDQISLALMHAASMMPLCQWVSNVRGSRGLETSREPIWILLTIDCQSLRIVHAPMLHGPATAYAYGLAVHTPSIGLLSNGCSATGPLAVKAGKMFMLGIASLLLFIPQFFLFLFLCLSLLS